MILGRLSESARWEGVHAGFADAFAFLRRPDLAGVSPGRYPLDGDRVVAIVERVEGKGRQQARLEAHRKYIDIQYTVAGGEEMGWKPLADCLDIDEPYDEARDVVFFRDAPVKWMSVPPGSFAVFYPADAHAPRAGTGPLHKVILKIAAL